MIQEVDTAPTTPAVAITFPNTNTNNKNNITYIPLLPEVRETSQLKPLSDFRPTAPERVSAAQH